MSVRLSTNQVFYRGVESIVYGTEQISNTQQQISTGTKILTPADDPVSSTRILKLNQEITLVEQYQKNIVTLRNRLEREDAALQGVSDILQRAQELTIQVGSGVINSDQRAFIGAELGEKISELANIMNTKDASGEYIFAGYQARTPPFQQGDDGKYRYLGDEGQRYIQIANTTFVPSGDTGKSIFVDVESAQPTFTTRANPLNTSVPPANITTGRVLDQTIYNDFYPEDIVIEFRPHSETIPPAPNFTAYQVSDGKPVTSNMQYSTGTTFTFKGIEIAVTGAPNVGDTFLIESSATQPLLTSLEHFLSDIYETGDTLADKAYIAQAVDDALTNLTNAQTVMLGARSRIGGRLNTVESTEVLNKDFELVSIKIRSELQDVDYAEAISRLTQEKFVLEAAQASFVRIANLSLFNFL